MSTIYINLKSSLFYVKNLPCSKFMYSSKATLPTLKWKLHFLLGKKRNKRKKTKQWQQQHKLESTHQQKQKANKTKTKTKQAKDK